MRPNTPNLKYISPKAQTQMTEVQNHLFESKIYIQRPKI